MNPAELSKPYVTTEFAAHLVWKIYGFRVLTINEMVSYDDKNFHIKVATDHSNPHVKDVNPDGYTLKVTNTGKSAVPGHFDSMHAVMTHSKGKGLRLPQPVKTKSGKAWSMEEVSVVTKGSKENNVKGLCGVHLLTFLPGVPVSTLTYTKDILWQWGNLLAQFQNALQDFSNEVLLRKELFWDLSHIPELEKFVSCIDEEQRKLVLSVLRKFPEYMEKFLPLARKGYLHGDFNENNILVRQLDHCYQVDGILDLDDVHYGTYAWDVGIMLAYVSLGCVDLDPMEGIGYALNGYLQLNNLSDAEFSLLKICIAGRLCQSLVLGAYSYIHDPQNSYILLSAKTGWERLKLIWETPDEVLLQKWKNLRNK